MYDAHDFELRGRWVSRPSDKMTPFGKFAGPVTCVALISAAAILWPVYQKRATERKLVEAAREYRVRAEHGEATAQYGLGNSYRRGEGVPRDYAEALRWYRKAADQGDALAQNNIGWMYAKGQGVPRDLSEALTWIQRAAAGGYEDAKQWLAAH